MQDSVLFENGLQVKNIYIFFFCLRGNTIACSGLFHIDSKQSASIYWVKIVTEGPCKKYVCSVSKISKWLSELTRD